MVRTLACSVCSIVLATMLVGTLLAGAGSRNGTTLPEAVSLEALAPIRGSSVRRIQNLQLLVADNPPFVLDGYTGRPREVDTPPVMEQGVLWVVAVGGRAGVIVAGYPRAEIYGVRGRGGHLTYLGRGRDAVASGDGASVWIKSAGESGCQLRRVGLDGRQRGRALPFSCRSTIQYGGELGLVVDQHQVINPATGRTLVKAPRAVIVAAVGKRLVLAGPGRKFTLLDTRTGAKRALPWLSALPGLDEPKADYQGRHVALAFADPAWQGGPSQAIDVWSLDTRSGALTHVPGMPALVRLKATSMEWTRDGRLVFLAESNERELIAVWRPGARRLTVKRVRLPSRTSGSDSFAPLG